MFDPATLGYPMRTNFDRERLRALLERFKVVVSRRGEGRRKADDRRLAFELEEQVLDRQPPALEERTFLRLAKWGHTNGSLYASGMQVAQKISQLLFGTVLDRERLGV
jgi:hypothetical protein